MVTLPIYYNSIKRFINSLVIKLNEVNIQQNYHFYVKYGNTPPDQQYSKYYQNITGSKNIIDPVVYVKLLESNSFVELTPELLISNASIKNELLKFDKYYIETVKLNPGMSDYIKGLLYDINLKDAITKPNYNILAYDASLIEENETYILHDIESFISKFMVSYNNRYYMADELYLSSMLGLLYTSLFNYVLTIKMKNILTNKTDSFHRKLHVMSYKYLANDTDILSLSTNIWLYGNMSRMKHNIGNNHILDNVTADIFNKEYIGIGKGVFKRNSLEYLNNSYSNINAEYVNQTTNLIIEKANESVYNVLNTTYDLHDLNKLFLNNDLIPKYKTISYDYYQQLLKDNYLSNTLTKMFLIDKPNKIKLTDESLFNIVVSNIIELANNNNVTHVIDFYNPINSKLYKLNSEQVELMLVYILYKINNLDSKDFSIKYGGILRDNIDKEEALLATWYKLKNKNILDYILKDTKERSSVTNKDTLTNYIEEVVVAEKKVWFLMTNSIDNTLKNDIENLTEYIFKNEVYEYNIDDIENKLIKYNFDSFLNKFTYVIILEALLKSVVDIETDELKKLLERYQKIINIFDKNTSYTVQLLLDIDFSDSKIVNAGKNNINLAYKSYLEIKDAEYSIYEMADYNVNNDARPIDNDIKIDDALNLVSSRPSGYMPIFAKYDTIKTSQDIIASMPTNYPLYSPSMNKRLMLEGDINYSETILNTNIKHSNTSDTIIGVDDITNRQDIYGRKDYIHETYRPKAKQMDVMDGDIVYRETKLDTDVKLGKDANVITGVDDIRVKQDVYGRKGYIPNNYSPNINKLDVEDGDISYIETKVDTDIKLGGYTNVITGVDDIVNEQDLYGRKDYVPYSYAPKAKQMDVIDGDIVYRETNAGPDVKYGENIEVVTNIDDITNDQDIYARNDTAINTYKPETKQIDILDDELTYNKNDKIDVKPGKNVEVITGVDDVSSDQDVYARKGYEPNNYSPTAKHTDVIDGDMVYRETNAGPDVKPGKNVEVVTSVDDIANDQDVYARKGYEPNNYSPTAKQMDILDDELAYNKNDKIDVKPSKNVEVVTSLDNVSNDQDIYARNDTAINTYKPETKQIDILDDELTYNKNDKIDVKPGDNVEVITGVDDVSSDQDVYGRKGYVSNNYSPETKHTDITDSDISSQNDPITIEVVQVDNTNTQIENTDSIDSNIVITSTTK